MRPVVIKIGGAAAGEEGTALDLAAELHKRGEPVVLVHGGGPLVGEWSKRLGLDPRFEGGLRVTDEPTRDVALAVLAGLVNKRLVAELARRAVDAVGLSGADGGILEVRRADARFGLVGEIAACRPRILEQLLGSRVLPVVAPAAVDGEGELLNVNADSLAGALAAALGARLLVLVTDVAGVRDGTGAVLRTLDPATVARLKREGAISGGMLPKIDACLVAAAAGATAAIVHHADGAGMRALLAGAAAGTVVTPGAA